MQDKVSRAHPTSSYCVSCMRWYKYLHGVIMTAPLSDYLYHVTRTEEKLSSTSLFSLVILIQQIQSILWGLFSFAGSWEELAALVDGLSRQAGMTALFLRPMQFSARCWEMFASGFCPPSVTLRCLFTWPGDTISLEWLAACMTSWKIHFFPSSIPHISLLMEEDKKIIKR